MNFWGLFEAAVHNNPELSDSQKFTYLKSYLCGEAERAIVGLTLIKENYKNAIDALDK